MTVDIHTMIPSWIYNTQCTALLPMTAKMKNLSQPYMEVSSYNLVKMCVRSSPDEQNYDHTHILFSHGMSFQ